MPGTKATSGVHLWTVQMKGIVGKEPHRKILWGLTGTEGPGTGVDCVTVVTARGSVEDTVVMALALVMFTMSPWVLTTSPWSLAAGGGSVKGETS